MRIVAGKYRHRLISYPDNSQFIRPTKDRVREAIFSSLGDLSGLTVLDLYSGSGAMGIEALSRNAKECYFVDKNNVAIEVTKQNIKSLNIDNAHVVKLDSLDALSLFKDKNIKYDLVILDPPYASGLYERDISYLIDNKLLNPNSRIVVEYNLELDLSKYHLSKIKNYHYGEIKVSILYL